MKPNFLVVGLISFFLLTVIGCKDQYKDCQKTAPALYVYGYDSTGADSIKVVKYQKGNNFSKRIDSLYFLLSQPPSFKMGEDSFFLAYTDCSIYVEQYENFDWIYTVISDGNTLKVTEVKRELNKTTSSYDLPSSCLSPITTLKVNGTQISLPSGEQRLTISKP